jgi:hypothetical protein
LSSPQWEPIPKIPKLQDIILGCAS